MVNLIQNKINPKFVHLWLFLISFSTQTLAAYYLSFFLECIGHGRNFNFLWIVAFHYSPSFLILAYSNSWSLLALHLLYKIVSRLFIWISILSWEPHHKAVVHILGQKCFYVFHWTMNGYSVSFGHLFWPWR